MALNYSKFVKLNIYNSDSTAANRIYFVDTGSILCVQENK